MIIYRIVYFLLPLCSCQGTDIDLFSAKPRNTWFPCQFHRRAHQIFSSLSRETLILIYIGPFSVGSSCKRFASAFLSLLSSFKQSVLPLSWEVTVVCLERRRKKKTHKKGLWRLTFFVLASEVAGVRKKRGKLASVEEREET